MQEHTTTVSVLDCGLGNVGSVLRMIEKVGGRAQRITTAQEIAEAEKIILPGVGHFDQGMRLLNEQGLSDALRCKVAGQSALVLGICLGMQMLFDRSEEGVSPGLGLIPGDVVRFRPQTPSLRIPHMGWNEVEICRENPLLPLAAGRPRFYFVHSYHAACQAPADVLATVHYGADVTAAVHRGKVYGTQFHPEKSHRFGMELMKRFVELSP